MLRPGQISGLTLVIPSVQQNPFNLHNIVAAFHFSLIDEREIPHRLAPHSGDRVCVFDDIILFANRIRVAYVLFADGKHIANQKNTVLGGNWSNMIE